MAFFIAAIRMVSSVTVGRLKPGTNMKLKTVEINGKQYAEIDTAGLPVYVHDDGKEIGFDAPLATKKITELNEIEEDAIKKHMWPCTVVPPKYKESYAVTLADKLCAVIEFFDGIVFVRKLLGSRVESSI